MDDVGENFAFQNQQNRAGVMILNFPFFVLAFSVLQAFC